MSLLALGEHCIDGAKNIFQGHSNSDCKSDRGSQFAEIPMILLEVVIKAGERILQLKGRKFVS